MSIIEMLKHALEQDDTKTKEDTTMTNFEKITQAKTKEEVNDVLFAFITDYNIEEGKINGVEWLGREYDQKETEKKVAEILVGRLFKNND